MPNKLLFVACIALASACSSNSGSPSGNNALGSPSVPDATPVPSATPVAPATPAPVPTAVPAPVPTATPMPLPTATPAPSPAPTPTATPTPAPTRPPTATPQPTATPAPTPTPSPTPTLVQALVSHPWCATAATQATQDRMALATDATLTYQQYNLQNGQRVGAPVFSYAGTWRLSGSTLTATVAGMQISATVTYTAQPTEQLHATYSGQTATYEWCN